MKKMLTMVFAAFLLAACSNPTLKWIDTPKSGDSRTAGQGEGKEILSFAFGIEGETDLPFGKTPDSSGKIPISIILPNGTGVSDLTPTVKFLGKSLDPDSGIAQDFSSPVDYTVTGEDDTILTYSVRVHVKSDSSKAIIRFALEVSGALTAEGVINEADGLITISVPAGTALNSITAHIAHTGEYVQGPRGNSPPVVSFIYTNGDFSMPTEWTVRAQDSSAKTYTVTVLKEKSHDKEIIDFSLGIPGENVIVGGEPQPDGKYPILVVVPSINTSTALPVDLGSSVSPVPPAFINYTGTSISPAPETGRNFSNPAVPVTYTVTAEDRSSREYAVRVIVNNIDIDDDRAMITGFYFTDPLVQGVIDEAARTIALTVPAGTNLSALRPEIYYIGKSVSPMSGQPKDFSNSAASPVTYTVRAQDGTAASYAVSVFTAAAPPVVDVPGTGGEKVDVGTNPDGSYTIIIEIPVFIDDPQININFPGGQITQNVTNNNTTIINNDYTVIVVSPPSDTPPASDAASIDAFYFTDPVAIGTIGTTGAGTPASPFPIDVEVPYGTELRNLAPVIAYTGKDIAGIPGASPLKAPARSFYDSAANRVIYTVEAQNGAAKTYAVTVTAGLNPAKEITNIYFTGGAHPLTEADNSFVISALPNADGEYPIEVTILPVAFVDISNVSVNITYTGTSIAGNDGLNDIIGPATVIGTPSDYRDADINPTNHSVPGSAAAPVKYTVTAADGSTKIYTLTIRRADTANDDEKEITGFYFTSPLAAGVINQDTNAIAVTVPAGTNITSLKPTVYFEGISLKPGSGSAVNFSGPVIYTVTARNGTTRPYTVTVNLMPSTTKDITRFSFPGIINTETVIGAIPNDDGTYPINVWVPSGTGLGSLAPAITHTGVSINPGSGTVLNFNTPQDYTVRAEDGSVKTYKVTVSLSGGSTKVITGFVFEAVPLLAGGSVRVVGSIDQTAYTIKAAVPNGTASLANLTPTITYLGKSITLPGGGDPKTANPLTDMVTLNFGSPLTYTVNDSGTGTQAYTVTVTEQSAVSVSFTGEKDIVFASSTYNQSTGVITVTADTGTNGIDPAKPIEWYVDGVKQAVSNAAAVFTLNVGNGSFIPGRHEIMVSGMKDGLHYTGKVYFAVSN